jgi:predicted XRE-type DNA-binding protein
MLSLAIIKECACEVAGIDTKEWDNNTAELAELRSVVVRWMYAYGMSEREIARMLGWSQQRVNERKNCTKTSLRIKAIERAFASAMENRRQA